MYATIALIALIILITFITSLLSQLLTCPSTFPNRYHNNPNNPLFLFPLLYTIHIIYIYRYTEIDETLLDMSRQLHSDPQYLKKQKNESDSKGKNKRGQKQVLSLNASGRKERADLVTKDYPLKQAFPDAVVIILIILITLIT